MTLIVISAVRTPYLIAPSVRRTHQHQANAPGNETLSEQKAADNAPLSLTQTGDSQIVAQSRSLAVLRYKSDLKVKQTDDGSLQIKFKSHLKFNYEFQSEDGTTIQIAAKLKTNISYKQTDDGSFEYKARVKFQLSVVQETVETGLAPLLESDDVTDGQSSAISSAQLDFGELIDSLTSQFLDGTLFGDDLIGNLVDAFNELTQSVQSELPEETGPPIVPAEEPRLDLPPVLVEDSVPPVVVADQDVSPENIAVVEDELPSDLDDTPNVDQQTDQPVGDEGGNVGGEVVESETDGPPETVVSSADALAPAVTSFLSNRSVFVDLRVKFVQSLSLLVSVLDTPSDGADTSVRSVNIHSRTKLDIRLAAYSQAQTLVENLSGVNVDANA